MQFNVIPRSLNDFNYCYLTLRILLNISYLFVLSVVDFKHCYLNTIDTQPLPSGTFNIK